MKISISTKVFLGFIVVLLVFGSSSLYTVFRTSEIRDRVVLMREGIVPLEKDVQRVSEELRLIRGLLMQRNPREGVLTRVRDRLESKEIQPLRKLQILEIRVENVAREAERLNLENDRLLALEKSISLLREGVDIATRVHGGPQGSYRKPEPEGSSSAPFFGNEAVFQLARSGYLESFSAGNLEESFKWYAELRMIVGDLYKSVREIENATSLCISEVNREAQADESRVVRDVIFTSSLALLISVIVMFITHQGIRRIRQLTRAVRSLSEGNFEVPVTVSGSDEVAELSEEFAKMGKSLKERNDQLAEQSNALLRSEKFATIGKISTLITHEIRNPLSSIGLNAEMLEEELLQYEGCDIEEGRALLRAIGGEVDRLRDVTEEYLQFARLPKPEPEPVDVVDLIQSIVQFVSPEVNRFGIDLEFSHEDSRIDAFVDSNQLRQALLNLIRNATEALESEGGRILVHTKMLDAENAMIRVEDSGPGVDFEVQPHIFEAFYSTKPSGTGLGLSLVQQIISEHNGDIRCQRSASLGGANFVIRIPVRPQPKVLA